MKACDLTPEARLKYKLSHIEYRDEQDRAGLCANGCKRPRAVGSVRGRAVVRTLCAECSVRNAERMRAARRERTRGLR